MMTKLTDREKDIFRAGRCPDCTSSLIEGPHGGLSVNWYCTHERCGSRFNDMGPFGVERITEKSPNLEKE